MEIKGILHCHSNYSYDAKLSLAELKALFLERGLKFVCMTEHTDELTREDAAAFVSECDELSDDSFKMIPGFEVPYKHAHILMIGQRDFFGEYAGSLTVLKEWTSTAPFVVLAHPVRNDFVVEDGLLDQLDALEVWNQQYEGKIVPRTKSLELYRRLKTMKPELVATGGVDLHRREHMGAPVITLDVSELNESTILEKLLDGAFSVSSSHAAFYGSLPNPEEIISAYRMRSRFSVVVITLGKSVNKMLAQLNITLPAWLKQVVRRRI